MRNRPLLLIMLIASIVFADTAVDLNRLPAAVQSAASRETENGQTTFEVETALDGKSRDLTFDEAAHLLAVEQEVTLDSLPVSAQTAIRSRLAGGTVKKGESEIAVNSDGTPYRD